MFILSSYGQIRLYICEIFIPTCESITIADRVGRGNCGTSIIDNLFTKLSAIPIEEGYCILSNKTNKRGCIICIFSYSCNLRSPCVKHIIILRIRWTNRCSSSIFRHNTIFDLRKLQFCAIIVQETNLITTFICSICSCISSICCNRHNLRRPTYKRVSIFCSHCFSWKCVIIIHWHFKLTHLTTL